MSRFPVNVNPDYNALATPTIGCAAAESYASAMLAISSDGAIVDPVLVILACGAGPPVDVIGYSSILQAKE